MSLSKSQMTSALSRESQEILRHLMERGHLSEDQNAILITESRLSGRSIAALVADLGFVPEDILYDTLSVLYGYPLVSLTDRVLSQETLCRIPREVAMAACALPIAEDNIPCKQLTCAMADPSDLLARDALEKCLHPGERLVLVMAKKSEILWRIQHDITGTSIQEESYLTQDNKLHALLYNLVTHAVAQDASDIHFEPHNVFVLVRFRCDGLLRDMCSFHSTRWEPLCNQIKVLAGMDITETRRPQDGRFVLIIMGRSIHFRVSSHPTIYGESIVVRILEKNPSLILLDNLGYSKEALSKITSLLKRPEGLIVVTGPTGSGKTTSLYSMLGMLDTKRLNIMTLEEPVEYRMPHIRQSEVKENTQLTFVTGMHSILRQDPDVILLGEIRDAQTAHMAVRASMTGHKVFTTLHTNTAWGAVQRFLDFQVMPSLFVGLFNGIIAQRLIRLLCPVCKQKKILSDHEARQYFLWPQRTVYEPVGCSACDKQGYKGRRAIAEILVMDAQLEELILSQSSPAEVSYVLKKRGFKTLLEEGREAILTGETSVEEVARVVGSCV